MDRPSQETRTRVCWRNCGPNWWGKSLGNSAMGSSLMLLHTRLDKHFKRQNSAALQSYLTYLFSPDFFSVPESKKRITQRTPFPWQRGHHWSCWRRFRDPFRILLPSKTFKDQRKVAEMYNCMEMMKENKSICAKFQSLIFIASYSDQNFLNFPTMFEKIYLLKIYRSLKKYRFSHCFKKMWTQLYRSFISKRQRSSF